MNEEEYAETLVILRSRVRRDEGKAPGHRVALRGLHRDLIFEFDREFSEIADASKQLIAAFFTEVRSLEDEYAGGVQEAAGIMLEQFSTGKLDDVCDEDAKVVLADKDTFMNAVRAHHDFHVNMIDQGRGRAATEEKPAPGR